MPSPQVGKLVDQILKALPGRASIEAAVEEVQNDLISLAGPDVVRNLADEFVEATKLVTQQIENVEILHKHSVIQPLPKWYFGSNPGDFHWPALQSYLLKGGWHPDDVQGIDEASNEVVSLLRNPKESGFSGRGLVVGHVQSGKTANMTAVIAKALDAGYNTVIILAGLTNKLRYQTQSRIMKDLVARDQLRWQVLTPNREDADFRAPAHGGFLNHITMAQLAIVKKNTSPLGELRTAVERTLPQVLAKLRVLIIDDECDQASVNTAKNELDMTAINEQIRQLLGALPSATYVGYTATPFANVLIDPYKADGQTLDDLYPRDFITALEPPERYFGTEKLFGIDPADPANPLPEEDGLDMIRTVPEDEIPELQAKSRADRADFRPSMADSLARAVLYFLACCAARRARGDAAKHMTMLVHTSAYVAEHENLAVLLRAWVERNKESIISRTGRLGKQLAETWCYEQGRLPDDITSAPSVGSEELFQYLPGVMEALEFPVENGSSDDRLNYEDGGPPRTYVVVGGTILARGLTLDGLMVSYFLRTANQYDTLLQMGRWFGYRINYEDLPRIWMPDDLALKFRALAGVEREVREDISQYQVQKLTPMDLAVRIRAIPGMAITAPTKMKAARQCAVSYWGTHKQTFRFAHKDHAGLQHNWKAGGNLVDLAEELDCRDEAAKIKGLNLWRDVPKSSVIEFFEKYRVHSTHADLNPEMLVPFISKGDPRLEKWNIVIVGPRRGDSSGQPLGAVGHVQLNTRAQIVWSGTDADIKALMSKGDMLLDCEEKLEKVGSWDQVKERRLNSLGQRPLLLLYPICRASEPKSSVNRKPLDAAMDVLGYGVVFPGSKTEGGNYVSVELSQLSAEEIVEIEAEERAQAEAAGVE